MTEPSDRAMEIAAKIGPFKLRVVQEENYGGEHREWYEYLTIPQGNADVARAAATVIDQHLPSDASCLIEPSDLMARLCVTRMPNLPEHGGGFVTESGKSGTYRVSAAPPPINPDGPEAADLIATLQSQLAAAHAKVERLAGALAPFAAEADRYDPPEPGDDLLPAWDSDFSTLALRIARAALKEIDHEQ